MTHSKYERDFYLHSFLPFSLNINQIKKESQTKNISSVTILISTKMVDFSKLTGLTDFSYFILERLNFEDLRNCAYVSRSWEDMVNQFLNPKLSKCFHDFLVKLKETEIEVKTRFESSKDVIQVKHEEWEQLFATFKTELTPNEKLEILTHLPKHDLRWTVCSTDSILHYAASNGMTKLICHLFTFMHKYGIDVNARNRINRTAFLSACKKGQKEVVELFLKYSSTLNIGLNNFDHYAYTPLIYAAKKGHYEVVRILLQNEGIDVNGVDEYDRTAFNWACINGNIKTVKVIIEYAVERNIDLNKQDKLKATGYINTCTLTYPTFKKYRIISQMLRDNAERIGLDLTKKDISGRTGDDWNRQRDLDEWILSAREKLTSKLYQNFCTKNECCRIFNPYPKSNVPAQLHDVRPEEHSVAGRKMILSDDDSDDESLPRPRLSLLSDDDSDDDSDDESLPPPSLARRPPRRKCLNNHPYRN